MRALWVILLLWVGLGVGGSAEAFYLLPYKLTVVRKTEGGILQTANYSAFVFLGNYFRRYYGGVGPMEFLTHNNDYPQQNDFFEKLLVPPYRWYEDRIRAHPKIYGDAAELIIAGLFASEFPDPATTSIVLITEENNIFSPQAMLRVTNVDEEGLLASERHFRPFLKSELVHTIPNRVVIPVPYFSSESVKGRAVDLLDEAAHHTAREIHQGTKAELKNFAIDEKAREEFLPYLYLIARRHRMFHYGIPHPRDRARLQLESGHPEPGAVITEFYSDCYGKTLSQFYRLLGLKEEVDKINNRETGHRDLHFLKGLRSAMDQDYRQRIGLVPGSLTYPPKAILQFDDQMQKVLGHACLGPMVESALVDSFRRLAL